MKNIFLVLVIVFAFGMNANAQDIAMVDNDNTIEVEVNEELNQTNKANFNRNYGKTAEKLSIKHLNGGFVGLQKGYTYKDKFHWSVVKIVGSDMIAYAFISDTDFTSIKFKQIDGKKKFETYILENY